MRKVRFALTSFVLAVAIGGLLSPLASAVQFDDFSVRVPPAKAGDAFVVKFQVAGAPITVTFTVDKNERIRITNVEGVPENLRVSVFRDRLKFRERGVIGDKLEVTLDPQFVRNGVPRTVRVRGDVIDSDDDDDGDDDDGGDDPCDDEDPEDEQECEDDLDRQEAEAECRARHPEGSQDLEDCLDEVDAEFP